MHTDEHGCVRQGWWLAPGGRLFEVEEHGHDDWLQEHAGELGLTHEGSLVRLANQAQARGWIRLIRDYDWTYPQREKPAPGFPMGWGVELDEAAAGRAFPNWKQEMQSTLRLLGAKRGEQVHIYDIANDSHRQYAWDQDRMQTNPRAFQVGKGLYGGELLTPSARRPGAWQLTNFLPDGTPAGHEEFESLEEALADVFFELRDNPLASLISRQKAVRAWEEATLSHPYANMLMDYDYAYVSPLRPLSGVSVEGEVSADSSGRIGVLYRSEPMPWERLKHLSLVPVTPEAVKAAAASLAALLVK